MNNIDICFFYTKTGSLLLKKTDLVYWTPSHILICGGAQYYNLDYLIVPIYIIWRFYSIVNDQMKSFLNHFDKMNTKGKMNAGSMQYFFWNSRSCAWIKLHNNINRSLLKVPVRFRIQSLLRSLFGISRPFPMVIIQERA